MSKDMSQEEANLAVAAALMREAVSLRKENARLREALIAYQVLGATVAEWLDADVAWTNDECDEAVVVSAINATKKALYAARAALRETEE